MGLLGGWLPARRVRVRARRTSQGRRTPKLETPAMNAPPSPHDRHRVPRTPQAPAIRPDEQWRRYGPLEGLALRAAAARLARMLRSPKLQCKSEQPALGSSRPRLRTPASAGQPSQSSSGRDNDDGCVVTGRRLRCLDVPCDGCCEVRASLRGATGGLIGPSRSRGLRRRWPPFARYGIRAANSSTGTTTADPSTRRTK